jgi:hypothetical protein
MHLTTCPICICMSMHILIDFLYKYSDQIITLIKILKRIIKLHNARIKRRSEGMLKSTPNTVWGLAIDNKAPFVCRKVVSFWKVNPGKVNSWKVNSGKVFSDIWQCYGKWTGKHFPVFVYVMKNELENNLLMN